jgi:hypothetical protein
MKIFLLICVLLIIYIHSNQSNSKQYTPPSPSDNPKIFFKNVAYTTFVRAIPTQGRVARTPWSGDYLAHRYGGASARYGAMDTRYKSYPVSINMYHQPGDYLANKGRSDFSDYVNKYYSATEKYDLYVGDYQFTLTRSAKYLGAKFNKGGDFASWMGLCHGLSPASYMVPTPNRAIRVLAADGKTVIEFLPDDVKALAATWWANIKFDNRLAGKRHSAIDAASFFLIFGNQIGRYRQNMAVEPFADAEIWNYGAIGYKAVYYNVVTGKQGAYSDSRIPKSSSGNFSNLGSAQGVYVLGVKFTIIYANTVNLKHIKSGQTMTEKTSDYSFALYLDIKESIVGSVWTSRSKPSYVWGPDKIPEGPFDKYLPSFGGSIATLNNITKYTAQSSAQYLPLRSIVYYLARMSA